MAGKVIKVIGKMQHTRGLILVYLETLGKPARTSEISKIVLKHYPEAAVYTAMNDMQADGDIKRLTFERDGLFALKEAL